MTAPPTHPPAGLLYDARRDSHHVRPLCRGWLHLVFCGLSLVAGGLLVQAAQGPRETAGAAVYAASVCGLFGTSALYHRGTWSVPARRRLQRLDQSMIAVLVAGTATPVAVLAVRDGAGYLLLAVVWAAALTVIVAHLVVLEAPEALVGGAYIGLGGLSAVGLPALWQTAGHTAGWLVLGGGVLYLGGALGYHLRRPDPWPTVFGYHEVFHVLVCLAATCHFLAIAVLLGAR